ncbi:MAG: peptidoglycan DD-metalloendopeptidase family protein [Campylobacteraceae bacterium]|jgi:murein DD-endopeptidase MepM/ murein hydrolase activator NlpD|nr:peptidoglycan DD-metalloendopeptidase family protein [Campylobacteraceae bacterium]
MKKFFFVLLLLLCHISADTNSQITNNTKTLKSKEQLEKSLKRELSEISKTLQKEENALKKTQNEIDKLNNEIIKQQKDVDDIRGEVSSLQKSNQELKKEREEIEKSIIKIIAQDFSYFLVIDNGYEEGIESIITDEVLKRLSTAANKDFEEYAKKYAKTDEKIKFSNERLKIIQNKIDELAAKKKNLDILKNSKTKTVSNIAKEKSEYTERIKTTQREKAELQKTLEGLKILERDKNVTAIIVPENFESVRKLGSSYQASKVRSYKGAKTIAPLSNKFTVEQKFGDYIDPIYNIKIFNESVVLRSATPNSEVKNVLDGKVVFAKETSILKNVVIVENSNGIHTIYAQLSKIAPTIQVGEKIKKGYVIGRIDKDLTFEVTQKNYHINPLELITY